MLFIFSYLVGAVTGGLVSPPYDFKENFKSIVDDASVETMLVTLLPKIEADFMGQVSAVNDIPGFNQLVQALPFEADNLATGDCTFTASCNFLMLDELWQAINNGNVPSPRMDSIRRLLSKVATLTYFMHGEHFHTFFRGMEVGIGQLVLTQRGEDISTIHNQVESLYDLFHEKMKEVSYFINYKNKIINFMVKFFNSCNGAELVRFRDGGIRYEPSRRAPLSQEQGWETLFSLVTRKGGEIIMLNREFIDPTSHGVLENCYIHEAVNHHLYGRVDPATRIFHPELPQSAGLTGFLAPPKDCTKPCVLLLMPSARYGSLAFYTKETPIKRHVQKIGNPVEIGVSHAVVANLDTILQRNVWFNTQKGLIPQIDQASVTGMQVNILRAFESAFVRQARLAAVESEDLLFP